MLTKLSSKAITHYNGWLLNAHDTKLYHLIMHCFYGYPIKQVTIITTKKYIVSWFETYIISRVLFEYQQNRTIMRICKVIYDQALNMRFIIFSYLKKMCICQPHVFSLFLLHYLKRLYTQRKALQIVLEYIAPYSPCEDG